MKLYVLEWMGSRYLFNTEGGRALAARGILLYRETIKMYEMTL